MQQRKLVLRSTLSPGDVTVASALIRDIKRQYGDEILLDYRGSTSDYFKYCPHLTELDEDADDTEVVRLSYDVIHSSNQKKLSFIWAYYHDFTKTTGIDVRMTEFRPDIHFSESELRNQLIDGKYWVIASGGKYDYTAKWWDPAYWQEVVDLLGDDVKFVQVGKRQDYHPELKNVVDLRGRTSYRDLMRVILHSRGVCCVVTCLMPLAAACNRPCVVVAGGREPWWWQAYTRKNRDLTEEMYMHTSGQIAEAEKKSVWGPMIDHTYLHTVGKYGLSCCETGGCWRSRIEPAPGATVCRIPSQGPTAKIPKCLQYITPKQVVDAVRVYERSGLSDRYGGLPEDVAARKGVSKVGINLDKEILEPPVTVCVLLYGPYLNLHERCLKSIINNTPRGTFKLRIGLNEVQEPTRKLVDWVGNNVDDIIVTESPENIKKYPMMRKMFYDTPIDTRWVIWFDDDVHLYDPMWLQHLSRTMSQQYGDQYKMFGKLYYINLQGNQRKFIEESPWYHGVPLEQGIYKTDSGRQVTKDRVYFATGSFWAIESDILRHLDWPDSRINHNGGDVMLGEALHQLGHSVYSTSYGVKVNDFRRRGYSETPIGVK